MKEALLELMKERAYDAITVQAIIDRADVGRSTFYAHFKSKEELLFDGFARGSKSFANFGHSRTDSGRRFAFSVPMLAHLKSQKRFFLATFFGASNPRIREEVTGWLAELVRAELQADMKATVGTTKAQERQRLAGRAHCIAAAFTGLAKWWLTEGEDLEAEEVDRIFQDVIG